MTTLAEAMKKLRERIGVERPEGVPWNRVATADAIRHFAWGIGDSNPLYTEPEYAARTRYGRLVAPPTFVMTCGGSSLWRRGMQEKKAQEAENREGPWVTGLWTGETSEWRLPILEGDSFAATSSLYDVVERHGSTGGTMYEQIGQTTYRNQRGEIAAITRRSFMNMEKGVEVGPKAPEREKKAEEPWKPYHYTQEELDAIWRDYQSEEVRGASPRYWEDVKEGDAMGHMVKGPYTVSSMLGFLSGTGSGVLSDKMAWEFFRAHPRAAYPDPHTGIPDFMMRVHWDADFAGALRFPLGGFDPVSQRITWMGNMVTNWMGDDGFLKSLRIQLRRPNRLGDTQWFRGKVARKYVEGSEHLVDLEMLSESQRKERCSLGWATVRLPSRSG